MVEPTDLAGGAGVLVVIPTYNEAATVTEAIDRVRAVVPDAEVLVVDDDSPDGTGDLVARRADLGEQVHLLRRDRKRGLGEAYRAGFAWALDRAYLVVVQMDGDLSHPASALPGMLAALDDADLVVGSRYVPGGGVVGWPWYRQVISRGGSLYARIVLGLEVHDATAGYKAFRRCALESIDAVDSRSNGYCFQIEGIWRAKHRRLRVREVPITFNDRTEGTSKMSSAIVLEAVLRVLWWRLTWWRRPR